MYYHYKTIYYISSFFLLQNICIFTKTVYIIKGVGVPTSERSLGMHRYVMVIG